MKGSTGPEDRKASVSGIDRTVAYRRLARGYQLRRLWASALWSVSVVVLAGTIAPSLPSALAALGLVSLFHAAARLRHPAGTARESIVVDFVAAVGFVVLTSPPAAVHVSVAAYLLVPMLLFLPIAEAGRLVAGFVTVTIVTGLTDAPWTIRSELSETFFFTAVTALAAVPMAIWGYRRVTDHQHDNARLHADLARREREFHDLWEGSAVALYRVDMDGRFLRLNRRMVELIGIADSKAVRSLRIVDLWQDRNAHEEWLRALDTEGRVTNLEWEMRRTDGALTTVRDTARIVMDAAGDAQYVEGSIEDVSDRIETTRQLQFHASILEHVRSAVVATDTEGIVTYWNRHAERLHGWDRGETLGRPIFDVVVPASEETMGEILTGLREHGYWEGETEMRRSDGKLVPTRTVAGTLRDTRGEPIGSVGVSADITDLKRANRRLEHLLEFKDQFISAVSHELRTPLAALVGFVGLLESTKSDRESWPEYLGLVTNQTQELARIVEDLVVAGRLDQDDLTILPQQVRLGHIVDEVLEGWREASCVERGDLDLDVIADPLRLSQILRNLVANALQYGEPPQRISAEPEDRQVVIRVTDHGSGIPDHLRDDIFHPYQQGRIDRARPGHLGLGLHVARTLAELMHGELDYVTNRGTSCFSLRLPAAKGTSLATVGIPGRHPVATPAR